MSIISQSKLLAIAIILGLSLALPLLKRDMVKIGNKGWYFDLSAADTTAWANSVSTVCASGNLQICLGETVVATVLTGIMAVGNTGPVTPAAPAPSSEAVNNTTATDTPAASSKIVKSILSDVKSIPNDISNILSHSGLNLLGVYNLSSVSTVLTNAENAVGSILHFSSPLGEHLAAQFGENDLTKLALSIAKSVPGIPTFEKVTEKAEEAIEGAAKGVVNWVTYNINKDEDANINELVTLFKDSDYSGLASDISNFISNNGGYKFCLTPSTDLVNVTSQHTTPLFGELYLNTYGSVELECK